MCGTHGGPGFQETFLVNILSRDKSQHCLELKRIKIIIEVLFYSPGIVSRRIRHESLTNGMQEEMRRMM